MPQPTPQILAPIPTTADLVLEALSLASEPMDLDRLVAQLQAEHVELRAVRVKITALDLVSRGLAGLDSGWRLHSKSPPFSWACPLS